MIKLTNEIIEMDGRRWKVREAKSRSDALDAIAEARCTGSVGSKTTVDRSFVGGVVEVVADVVQINSDGTERKPYTEAY